jgi:hypothetical protein
MLTAFFYAKGIIDYEFVPEKQTVNGKFYKEVIRRLIARVHHIRPLFSGKWVLVSSAQQCTGTFLRHCFQVFCEPSDPHGISSTLLP